MSVISAYIVAVLAIVFIVKLVIKCVFQRPWKNAPPGLEAIKQFSSLDETTWRPSNPTLLELYSDGKDLGMGIGTGGPRWREQRRFAEKALGKLGAGKKGMDWKIMQEVQHVIDTLDTIIDNHQNGMTNGINKPKGKVGILRSVEEFFDLPDLNVIWELVAGIRYDYDDPVPSRQFELLRNFLQEALAGPITAAPSLKHFPYFSKIYYGIRRSMDEFRVMIKDVVKEQMGTFDPHHIRGYIDLFLNEQNEGRGSYFTDEDLIINCQDLFIAGSETASKSLSSTILWLVRHPEVQLKCQQEIDKAVGRERSVTMEDKANLPYTEATLMEVRRISTPFPITPPRTSHKDIVIGGYSIPAGTVVQMNLYSVLCNEKNFAEPLKFKPERFLDTEGKVFIPEAFIPFGYGKRRCLGENLANVSNFIFLANLLQHFNFRCIDPANPPDPVSCGGLTYGPKHFDVRISRRE